ncbi:unnamed protein product [Brachionus calyciflorus]|uniref:Uncharacterized protein n=1 Tax=Brachionus calyciflorus TaxID=104777 RepID=A0A814I912_9BILA|nr:unnamed protein product [Brachionus calyciflorus]
MADSNNFSNLNLDSSLIGNKSFEMRKYPSNLPIGTNSVLNEPPSMSNQMQINTILSTNNEITNSKMDSVNCVQLTNTLNLILKKFNKKREKDQALHVEFQECFTQNSNTFQTRVLDLISLKYDKYSREIQEKLDEISEDLARCSELESEITKISSQVEQLYKAINSSN